MNMMKKIYIGLFAILYLAVALVSTIHAIDFFGLANGGWMSIVLAISFELGQAAVLFSLLTSGNERKKIMPWVLMSIFTLVQVLGNVYSSYKYILLHSPENLKYFKEPIFIWTTLPDDQATVIVTYIVGAILPVCALLLTSMVTNQLEPNVETKTAVSEEIQNTEDPIEIKTTENQIKEKPIEELNEEPIEEQTEEPIENLSEEIEEIKETVDQEKLEEKHNEIKEIDQNVEDIFNGNITLDNSKNNKSSHFINI